jgi:hypothetical protein
MAGISTALRLQARFIYLSLFIRQEFFDKVKAKLKF